MLGADYANLLGSSDTSFTLSIAGAANDSETLPAVLAGPYGSGTIPFQSAVLIFQATTTGSATVTLADPATSGGIAVDNVALYGNVQLVPEPATTAEVLLGLGALAIFAARRRRA